MNKELKVSFVLKYPKEKISPIILLYTCSDGVLKYSIGANQRTIAWDKESQQPFNGTGRLEKQRIARMNTLENRVKEYWRSCNSKDIKVTKVGLQGYLRTADGKAKSTQGDFFSRIQDVINMAEKRELSFGKDNKYFTEGTITNWKKAKRLLVEFDPKLTFEGITLQTYQKFVNFCNGKEYTLNYTGSMIKNWKALMNQCRQQGYHSNMVYKEFKKGSEDAVDIYLTEEDLALLKAVELAGSQEEIRDRFILNCKMGLRISDMSVFETQAIIKDGNFTIPNKKSGKAVTVPLTDEYYELKEKYKGRLPKNYNSVFANREIKKIARQAGLTDQVLVMSTKGGAKVSEIKEKCDLISHHTARRTFVTLYLKSGGDSVTVESLAGMNPETVRKYDKRTKVEIAESAKANAFFARKSTPEIGG